MYKLHECIPAVGEWTHDDEITMPEVPRPAQARFYTPTGPIMVDVHYVDFDGTVLQVRTDNNQVFEIWERVER